MTRHCDRPGCSERATATLAYQYATSTVWLDPVAAEADPSTYDLCRRHAEGLSVPRGWTLEDRRGPATPSVFTAERAS
jgi:hypothetical protein